MSAEYDPKANERRRNAALRQAATAFVAILCSNTPDRRIEWWAYSGGAFYFTINESNLLYVSGWEYGGSGREQSLVVKKVDRMTSSEVGTLLQNFAETMAKQ